MAKYIVEVSHGTLRVLESAPGRVRFEVDVNPAYSLHPWIRHGKAEDKGARWIDGRWLRLTGRSVRTEK